MSFTFYLVNTHHYSPMTNVCGDVCRQEEITEISFSFLAFSILAPLKIQEEIKELRQNVWNFGIAVTMFLSVLVLDPRRTGTQNQPGMPSYQELIDPVNKNKLALSSPCNRTQHMTHQLIGESELMLIGWRER